jgi:hypothetical protein
VILPSATLDTNPIELIGTIAVDGDEHYQSGVNLDNVSPSILATAIPAGRVIVGQIIPSGGLPKKKRSTEVQKRHPKRCKSTRNAPIGTDLICGAEGCPGADNRDNCTNMDYTMRAGDFKRRRSRERSYD